MKPDLLRFLYLSIKYIFVVLLFGLLAGCAMNPVSIGSGIDPLGMTGNEEVVLGKSAYLQLIQKNGGRYIDVKLGAYVSAVGQRLVRHSGRPELNFNFIIINDSVPNHFALPGGYVAITRGLLAVLTTESELAAVLGHSIGHVTARHNLQGIQRETLSKTASHGPLAFSAGRVSGSLINKRYSLEQEAEAERLAIDSMVKAGYDPSGAVQVQKLFYTEFGKDDHTQWRNGFFRSHPFVSERLSGIRRYIDEQYPLVTGEGQDVIEFARAIISLTLTRQGYFTFDMAKKLEKEGQLAEAINLYHFALLEAPGEALILCHLGLAYLRNEDLVPARRYFIKAINLQDDYYQSHLALGYVYLQKQQHAKALQQLETGFKLLPTLEGGYLLAEARENVDDLEGAIQLYRAVAKVDSTTKLGRNAAARLRILENK